MRINEWFEIISLKKKFAAFFVLVAIFPTLIATVLIVSFLHLDRKSKAENEKKIENQIKFALTSALKSVGSDSMLLSRSNAFLDFLVVPDNLRVYTENRLFGLIHEVSTQSQMKPSFFIFNSNQKEIFRYTDDRNIEIETASQGGFKSGYKMSTGLDRIYYTNEIRFDDQQLQGPTAKIRGYLVAVVPVLAFEKTIPELAGIISLESNLNMESLEIQTHRAGEGNEFSVVIFLVVTSGILALTIFSGLFFVNRSILTPISNITREVLAENSSVASEKSENEIAILGSAILSYNLNMKKTRDDLVAQSKLSTLVSVASQVAHDIRSPLTALNMVVGVLDEIPEEKRIVVRSAIQRINDIANDLLSRGRSASSIDGQQIDKQVEIGSAVMLSSLVDSLVSEKRIQYRERIGVSIDIELSKSYGLFTVISPNDLKRVLSNLINNSVEALINEFGKILIVLDECDGFGRLRVFDSGRGIANEVVGKLGAVRVTDGKYGTQSGFGLGVYHAKMIVEGAGGKISFESPVPSTAHRVQYDFKTVITLSVPKAIAPDWFVTQLDIPKKASVVVLDDDQSIHDVWRGRLASFQKSGGGQAFVSFTSIEAFRRWRSGRVSIQEDVVYLVDFEFVGQSQSGLDIVEEMNLGGAAILVTSRYEEKSILERCNKLGVRLIPKPMAGIVPINILDFHENVNAILIDDDELIHLTWKISAKKSGKNLICFSSVSDFILSSKNIDRDTSIFIDSNLRDDLRGEVLSKEIYEMGFLNIFVTTGYDSRSITPQVWIKGVIGKEPPWHP